MDKSIFDKLHRSLQIADMIGTNQTRELVYRNQSVPVLTVFIYCEQNHIVPHVHAYFKNEYDISIAINNSEILAGNLPSKYIKVIVEWLEKYRSDILIAWQKIQLGEKPSIRWESNV